VAVVRGAPVQEAEEEPRVRLGAEQRLEAPLAGLRAAVEKAAVVALAPLAWKAAVAGLVAVAEPGPVEPPPRPVAGAGSHC
jgi:hypothetical protein